MPILSADGRRVVAQIGGRHGFSAQAAEVLFQALAAGHGTMAQFDHPELGGMGQWSQGGLVMVGAMFDHSLKARVAAACSELSGRLASIGLAEPAGQPDRSGSHQQQSAGYGHGGSGASVAMPQAASTWWPADLGQPSATGAQNQVRYANFGQLHRLAIEVGGRVTVYDTGDHRIGGFSQQQSGDASVTFVSQHGLVRLADLAIVSPVKIDAPALGERAFRPKPLEAGIDPPRQRTGQYIDPPSLDPAAAPASAPPLDILATVERLGELQRKGILTEAEFAAKKAELLARL